MAAESPQQKLLWLKSMRSGSCNNQVLRNGNSQTKSSLCPFPCLSPAMWSGVLSRIMLLQAILVCTERRKVWRMSRFPKDTPPAHPKPPVCTRLGQSVYSKVWWQHLPLKKQQFWFPEFVYPKDSSTPSLSCLSFPFLLPLRAAAPP